MHTTSIQGGRIRALDGLRGIAVSSVLIAHLFPHSSFFWRLMQYGKFGVDLFFLLSGYLITGILLDARRYIESGRSTVHSAWIDFYAKRVLRIFPLYYGVITILCVIGYAPVLDVIWWHLTYTSNVGYSLFGIQYANLSHFWSLCVEEQFYLIIPMIVLLLPPSRSFSVITITAICFFIIKTIIAFILNDVPLLARMPFTNYEGIFFGASIAYAIRLNSKANTVANLGRIMGLVGGIASVCFCYSYYQMRTFDSFSSGAVFNAYQSFSDLAFSLLFWPIMMMIVTGRLPRRVEATLSSRPLRYLGTISYGVYVYHFAMLPVWPRILGLLGIDSTGYLAFIAEVAITIMIASVSWYAIEKPILRLKRLLPSRVSAVPSAAQ